MRWLSRQWPPIWNSTSSRENARRRRGLGAKADAKGLWPLVKEFGIKAE
jgi:hypothetical protein